MTVTCTLVIDVGLTTVEGYIFNMETFSPIISPVVKVRTDYVKEAP